MRYNEPETLAEKAARLNRDMLHRSGVRPDPTRAAPAPASASASGTLRKLPTAGAMRKAPAPTVNAPPRMPNRPNIPGTAGAGSLGKPPDKSVEAVAAMIRATVEAAAAALAPRINRPRADVAADLLRLTGEGMAAGKSPEAALEAAKADLIGRVMGGGY